jgi:hypothetical protein
MFMREYNSHDPAKPHDAPYSFPVEGKVILSSLAIRRQSEWFFGSVANLDAGGYRVVKTIRSEDAQKERIKYESMGRDVMIGVGGFCELLGVGETKRRLHFLDALRTVLVKPKA